MTAAQRRAADPRHSAWVTASAGTGKTKVLTDRVLRLLLAGTRPERLLCLTFTKAAAAEMANRIATVLAGWAVEDTTKLSAALAELTGETPDEDGLEAARRLFARVLDAPGGLKVQTVHAFCQSLLARFPLEAGLPPHFDVLDERTEGEMLRESVQGVLREAEARPSSPAARALPVLTRHANEGGFAELMQALTDRRHHFRRIVEDHGGPLGLAAAIRARLGVAEGETEEGIVAAAVADEALDRTALERAAQALQAGASTDVKRGGLLAGWLADPAARHRRFPAYREIFLTTKDEPRKPTKGAKAAMPEIEEVMAAEAERLLAVDARYCAVRVAAASGAVAALGAAVLDGYEAAKRLRARLDFDDLVERARELLSQPGIAPWVLFKLDGGLDHILVDEAQDTSPGQWEVVARLAEEFFAGEGAGRPHRTVFAVGDAKQSIYGFQGADPAQFVAMRRHFAERAAAAREGFAPVTLDLSFRSTAAVLRAVDAVFAAPGAADGVALDGEPIRHAAHREAAAGLVELWPLAEPEGTEAKAPWSLPLDQRGADSPSARLAVLLAARIARWTDPACDDPEGFLESSGRRMGPGDVMVLVPRRGPFVEGLVRALKERGVPVAGVDRMVLTEQLAVEDLVAFGQALLLPEDDLVLATVLKCPLVGMDEDALFRLAHGRRGRLWRALEARRDEEPAFAAAHQYLAAWRARADYVRPFELYAAVLAMGGRERLVARLGVEAEEPIDEFMTLALSYERSGPPSLQGFLHWLAAGGTQVKRELDRGRGEVRVMTVHGAKGLQAPVVILPDTTGDLPARNRLLWHEDLVLWAPRRDDEEEVCRSARRVVEEAEQRERRRLLYVALTRAEDRLYVCGWRGTRAPSGGHWHQLVGDALTDIAEPFVFDCVAEVAGGWAGRGLRLRTPQGEPVKREAESALVPAMPLPAWAACAPAAEPVPPRPLAPSRPAGDEPAVRSPLGPDDGWRFQRGRIVHTLLQVLPDLPPERWEQAAARYLSRPVLGLDEARRAAVAAETLAVLRDPRFAHLFGPDSRAEVPVTGLLEGVVVSGQIDRLAIGPDRVTIVDYKTNRPPPAQVADVPPVYLRQMAVYRALLARAHPGRRVECVLLWTDGPFLMPLPEETLAPALLDRFPASS